MKFYLFCLALLFCVSFDSLAQNQLVYLDEKGKEISKSKFEELQKDARFSFTAIDQSKDRVQIVFDRVERGTTKNIPQLIQHLESSLERKFDTNKPIVILYYPGADPCNTSGNTTPKERDKWYTNMEKGSAGVPKSNFVYIYKDNKGLKTQKLIDWKPDPNQIIKKEFFPFHYPCGSFTILFENRYVSFFGEYAKETVWKYLQEIATQTH